MTPKTLHVNYKECEFTTSVSFLSRQLKQMSMTWSACDAGKVELELSTYLALMTPLTS